MASKSISQAQFEIYVIRHRNSEMAYVGCTSKGHKKRWTEHLATAKRNPVTYLHRALAAHGEIAFEITVLARASSRDELTVLERHFIAELGTMAPNGYNMTAGGDGTSQLTQEVIERRRQAKIGTKWAAPMSDESRAKLRVAIAEKWKDRHYREAVTVAAKNKTYSAATLKKIAAKSKLNWANEEYRIKTVEAHRAAKLKTADQTRSLMLEKWADPDFREKMLAARAAARKRRRETQRK